MLASKRVLLVLGVATLAACGGAPGEAASPSSAQDAPSDLEALAEQIETAERSLSAQLGADSPATPAAGQPGPEPEGTQKKPAVHEPGGLTAEQSPSQPSSPCETACKALASMRRSQERICELTTPTHERCEWAKQKVADATARVDRAGCACS
jgi:hypothetical protein